MCRWWGGSPSRPTGGILLGSAPPILEPGRIGPHSSSRPGPSRSRPCRSAGVAPGFPAVRRLARKVQCATRQPLAAETSHAGPSLRRDQRTCETPVRFAGSALPMRCLVSGDRTTHRVFGSSYSRAPRSRGWFRPPSYAPSLLVPTASRPPRTRRGIRRAPCRRAVRGNRRCCCRAASSRCRSSG